MMDDNYRKPVPREQKLGWMRDADVARLHQGVAALLPLGSLEPHAHLPLAADTLIAGAILGRIAALTADTLLFPAIPVGHLFKYAAWPGALGVSHRVLSGLILDLCRGLNRMGVSRLLVMSGHDENREPALEALREAHVDTGLLSVYCHWLELAFPEVLQISESRREGHASEIQTSVFLYLFPQAPVDLPPTALRAAGPPPPGADDLFASGEQGLWVRAPARHQGPPYIGDPGRATPEKGRIIVEAVVRRARDIIAHLLAPQK
jgi:creatinine amidohydrolase